MMKEKYRVHVDVTGTDNKNETDVEVSYPTLDFTSEIANLNYQQESKQENTSPQSEEDDIMIT